VVSPATWARTDGAGLDPRVREWLLAMFAYYERHGLPVGTLPMRAVLGRAPTTLEALARRWAAEEHGSGADSTR
jgi:NAD(P)H dehydrogenase (quinone)